MKNPINVLIRDDKNTKSWNTTNLPNIAYDISSKQIDEITITVKLTTAREFNELIDLLKSTKNSIRNQV